MQPTTATAAPKKNIKGVDWRHFQQPFKGWLIGRSLISEEKFDSILNRSPEMDKLIDALYKCNISDRAIFEGVAFSQGIPFLILDHYHPDAIAREVFPKALCQQHKILPLFLVGDQLTLAMARPWDLGLIDDLHFRTNKEIYPVAMTPSEIEIAIESQFSQPIELAAGPDIVQVRGSSGELGDMSKMAEDSTVIRLVNFLLDTAVEMGASDIHLEPKEDCVRVRYRVDGHLTDRSPLLNHVALCVISRIKVMAEMDITLRRVPQDGELCLSIRGRKVDMRVSTLPTVWGEKVVIRILESSHMDRPIDSLGIPSETLEALRSTLDRDHGFFLVTGPTGSGKSTTLYAMLKMITNPHLNIVTLENPVELRLRDISQGHINPKAGFTFASGLRSILRQDPDIIMVGEIRDNETLEIAIQASLTGHLVLSTLHTNGTLQTISRLLQMGVEPYMVTDSLIGVLTQRLVRKICEACAGPEPLSIGYKSDFEKEGISPEQWIGKKGKGCAKCLGTGYFGRIGIFEYLSPSPELKELIHKRGTQYELKAQAKKEGIQTFRSQALRLVLQGVTTMAEVWPIIQE